MFYFGIKNILCTKRTAKNKQMYCNDLSYIKSVQEKKKHRDGTKQAVS